MDEKAEILTRISDAIRDAATRSDFESAGTLSSLARFIAPLDYQDLAVVCSVFLPPQRVSKRIEMTAMKFRLTLNPPAMNLRLVGRSFFASIGVEAVLTGRG